MNCNLIDLSHEIASGMPVFPGDPFPKINLLNTIKKDGYQETQISFATHTGTHIDCPVHFYEESGSTSTFPADRFFGKGMVINCLQTQEFIKLKDISGYETQLKETDFVLFQTGWDKYWGTEKYFSGFPILTKDAVDYLLMLNLKGIGFDTISADAVNSKDLYAHKKILKEKIVIIENLTNLTKLLNIDFYFSCFPLKIKNGDGSPVRAVAYLIK